MGVAANTRHDHRRTDGTGGLNWGLIAIAEFDLVAQLTGNEFGESNTASRLIYGLVGAAATYRLAQPQQGSRPLRFRLFGPSPVWIRRYRTPSRAGG